MDRSALEHGSARCAPPVEANWITLYKILIFLRSVEGHRSPQYLAIETEDVRSIGFAQPH